MDGTAKFEGILKICIGVCIALFGLFCLNYSNGDIGVIIVLGIPAILVGLWLIWDGHEEIEWEAEKARKKAENEKMPPVDITAAEILSNTIRAKSLYKDRRLNVTGTITKISGGSSVLLGAGITLDDDFYCDFAWHGSVESVSTGQKVTIQGVFRVSDFGTCFLKDCRISSSFSPQSYSAIPRTVSPKPSSPKKTAKPSATGSKNPVDSITATEILSDIDRAKALYNDKHLSVTGTIAKISYKSAQVILNGINGLICRFALPIMLNGLSTGQFVNIGGVFRSGCMEQCYVSPVNYSPQNHSASPQVTPVKQPEPQKTSTPSIDAMLNKANSGDPKAQYDLGVAYLEGKIVHANPRKYIGWIEKAAKNNYPQALFELAMMNLEGVNFKEGGSVSRNTEKGISLMKQAAELGFEPAVFFMEHQEAIALKIITEKADNGDVESQLLLGFMYCEGKDVKQDIDKSIHYFRMADKQNDPMAHMTVNLYEKFGPEQWTRIVKTHLQQERGDKISADSHSMLRGDYDSISRKAENGDAEAQYQLGIYCADELKDPREAVKWLYKANKQGHSKAGEAMKKCFELNPELTSWFVCNPDVKNW